jgi:antitoxin component YwqK of YwqJK toxin-antitoxin module
MVYRTLVCFLPLALLLFSASCSQPRTEAVERTDEYGYIEKFERRLEDFAKEGSYRKLKADGTLVEEAQYRHDTLDGSRILYYDNGDTSIVENYRSGQFDGPYRRYHENGQLQQAGQYAHNELVGEWTSYYDNGQIREIVQFKNNLENGPFIEYYPNGKLKAEGQYLDGDNEHGELKLYNESGTLIRTMKCERGRCQTTWAANDPANR